MAELGHVLLYIGFVASLIATPTAFAAVKLRSPGLLEAARRTVAVLFVTLTACCGILIYLLVNKDYTVMYVWRYTSLHLPAMYSAAALWAGNAGSLLFWAWLLSAYSVLAVNIGWRRNLPFMPTVISVLSLIAVFLIALVLFVPDTNPFEKIPGGNAPQEGNGLNPQLENPFMVIHPPCLYLGYVGFSIPFAFAMAALIAGRLDSTWIRSTRVWTMISWFFLSVGNILGGWWAYVTLGWGGYWAWDPVENAAFMPWLLATAYIHSVIIQETKGMLKIWNIVLVIMTFLMTVFGTFLTRSGILQSVHAFAQSPTFTFAFLWFLLVTAVIAFGFVIARLRDLRTEARMESLLSRESSFLFNNVLLVAAGFTVLWGTIFPLVSEFVRGVKVSVGPPFFNMVLNPVWLALLLLMGIGPLIAWRKATLKHFKRNLLGPIFAGVAGGIVLAAVGITGFWPLTFLSTCVFVTATIVLEFTRGAKVRAAMTQKSIPIAAVQLVSRQKRRYGGYIVHFGVVVMVLGIVLSSYYREEKEVSLQLGESVELAPYTLTYSDFNVTDEGHKMVFAADLQAQRGDKTLTLDVRRDYFPGSKSMEWWSRACIKSNWQHDLYVTMPQFDTTPYQEGGDDSQPPQIIALHIRVLPAVMWIWIGGYILIVGTVIAMWPEPVPSHLRGKAAVPKHSASARA